MICHASHSSETVGTVGTAAAAPKPWWPLTQAAVACESAIRIRQAPACSA